MIILTFFLITCTFISLWIKRDPKIWFPLFSLSLLTGLIAGLLTWMALPFILALILLWQAYHRNSHLLLFSLLTAFSLLFRLIHVPGFPPYFVNPSFAIGLKNLLLGLFPLALIVPLAKGWQDWKKALKGLALGLSGIGLLALLALLSKAIHLNFKIPPNLAAHLFSNLVLVSIPEEGFYRGFIQASLSRYLNAPLAILLSSALFTLSHIFWSPHPAILVFTFLASLLYGGVYHSSKKIESAILCHFCLNFIYMTFFR
ncbi:MAG: CPBP family intramembrane metalloprotease [Parachlamydia sp.]|jgi:hypothetical protein|nr:CPBP family intramembrane metalloprotease [Parachlamydia sp.]